MLWTHYRDLQTLLQPVFFLLDADEETGEDASLLADVAVGVNSVDLNEHNLIV